MIFNCTMDKASCDAWKIGFKGCLDAHITERQCRETMFDNLIITNNEKNVRILWLI